MANTDFAYVRDFEQPDSIPPSNFIVVRIDGRGFSKFTKRYNFEKPNDVRALNLMNAAATEVVRSFVDIIIAYGQSDEYSFVLAEDTTMWDRRSSKLATGIATMFTAEYCMQWQNFFPAYKLERPLPTFDGRCVAYPKKKILRDYLSWRQADCHINNLYNTTFWAMVMKGGMTPTAAELELKGTVSSDKNEILFSRFAINYNNEPQIFRKGTIIYREYGSSSTGSLSADDFSLTRPSDDRIVEQEFSHLMQKRAWQSLPEQARRQMEAYPLSKKWTLIYQDRLAEYQQSKRQVKIEEQTGLRQKAPKLGSKSQLEKEKKKRSKAVVVTEHIDMIGDAFWEARPWILTSGHNDQDQE